MNRVQLLHCTNLQQQVGEGVVVGQALSLKAIWSWEMPPYKYTLLNCFSCLETVRLVLTFDPYTCLSSPRPWWSPILIHVFLSDVKLGLCTQTHEGNGETFDCKIHWDMKSDMVTVVKSSLVTSCLLQSARGLVEFVYKTQRNTCLIFWTKNCWFFFYYYYFLSKKFQQMCWKKSNSTPFTSTMRSVFAASFIS